MLTSLFRQASDPPRSAPQLWGDPFADDGWCDVVRVSDWDRVDEDELFRFMPGLRRATSGLRPSLLCSAFERCFDGARLSPRRRVIAWDFDGSPEWHEAVELVRRLARQPIEMTPNFSDHDAVRVAVLSGGHPAFVWAEALVSHDRFATFAWLGCLARARRALVPLEVAEYLVATLGRDDRRIVADDNAMNRLIRSDSVARALLRAAKKRLARASVVMDLDSISIRAVSALRSWS